jgi:hypothetical protein
MSQTGELQTFNEVIDDLITKAAKSEKEEKSK